MANEKNYENFRGVLRAAICNRTQAQFALDSGISPEHLSRILNREKIGRPSQATLGRIAAAAKNGITLQDLLNALAQDDGIESSQMPSPMKLSQAREDFKQNFQDAAEDAMETLSQFLSQEEYPFVSDSVQEYADNVITWVNAVIKKSGTPVSYEMGRARDYFGHHVKNVSKYVHVHVSMASRLENAESTFIIYFNEIACADGSSKALIQRADCSARALQDLYGFAACDLERAEKILNQKLPWPDTFDFDIEQLKADNPDEEFGSEVMCMAIASELPYSLDFSMAERFQEKYQAAGATPEERVLSSIFGEKARWSETIDGFGFELDLSNPPEKLAEFLSKSPDRKYVLDAYDPDGSNGEPGRLDELKKILESGLDSKSIAEKLEEFGYANPDMWDDEGWGSAIATAMRAGTGFPFRYHKPAEDLSEFPNLSSKGCIIFDENDADGIQREALVAATCRYAKALGIKNFGDILFTGVRETFRKPMHYVVKDGPEAGTYENNDGIKSKGLIEYKNFDRADKSTHPETPGIYYVILKDGRYIKAVWAKHGDLGVWIRAHKEWSDQVVKYAYCPRSEPDAENIPE